MSGVLYSIELFYQRVLFLDFIKKPIYNADSMKFHNDEKDEEFIAEASGDDSAFDEIDATEGDLSARIKELKERLKTTEKERKEYLDGWQRAKADYLNSGKRFAEERSAIMSQAERKVIERLLPLADSFDMALKAADGERGALKEGFERMRTQLSSFLEEFGVKAIGEIGVPFDPYEHEALMNTSVTEKEQHDTVIGVLQKGYRQHDTLIRPAKVIVGQYESN